MVSINIGVDIGGRHIGIGLVNEEGNIIKKVIIDYDEETFNVQKIFDEINSFISKLKDYDIESIGIGIPGIAIDTYIEYTCNLPLSKVEIKDYIKTNIPIYVSNDANCATIAEYKKIDNEFYSNYAFVTIGTGIGAGIILNGQIYIGTTGSAGEIGHMVIDKDGLPCKCGRRGCFEQYASIGALKRMTNLDSLKEIFYLAERNEVIQGVLNSYLENLSEGLANLINMYDVEMLVIGGSLSEYSNEILHKLKSKIISKIYNKYSYNFEIKTAVLGNDAGILGASLLSQYNIKKEE